VKPDSITGVRLRAAQQRHPEGCGWFSTQPRFARVDAKKKLFFPWETWQINAATRAFVGRSSGFTTAGVCV
jgi:hypothetical protein